MVASGPEARRALEDRALLASGGHPRRRTITLTVMTATRGVTSSTVTFDATARR